jgi:RNA polymerase-binding transcription factor DksA
MDLLSRAREGLSGKYGVTLPRRTLVEIFADQGTDAMEREKAFLFASQEGRFLWHIDQALRRLYKQPDSFGKCHNCGEEIAYDRLDALPHARFCIKCKQREEDGKP